MDTASLKVNSKDTHKITLLIELLDLLYLIIVSLASIKYG